MKNLLKALSFAAVVGLFATSCTPDPCKDVVCNNGGTCVDGSCVCATGYEGTNCDTEVRTKAIGTWTVADSCSNSGTASYTVTVVTSTGGISEVKITNFWGTFTNQVVATVSGSTVTIARQQPDNDNFYVEGTGTVSGNTITWSYTISDETVPTAIVSDVCSSTWTK